MTLAKEKCYNEHLFNDGMAFFNSGLDYFDAPIDKQNDQNFRRGFEKAKRDALIKEITKKRNNR